MEEEVMDSESLANLSLTEADIMNLQQVYV